MTASPRLFDRISKVTIGKPGETGKVWTDLRVLFRVQKTADATPNKLELDIYNMSKDSRHYVESAYGSQGWAVVVEAGYKATGLKLLFTGRLELATGGKRGAHNHHKQGADWVTKIEGRDGVRAYKFTILSHSFGAKTSQKSVIEYVAKQMGVNLGKLVGIPKGEFSHGRQLSGPAAAELNALCRSHGLRWSVQNGVMNILPVGASLGNTAILISEDNGMVGSPELTEKGVKVTTLLRGEIEPGMLVEIKSQDVNGTFVVEAVHHRGDSWDEDWVSELECINVTA